MKKNGIQTLVLVLFAALAAALLCACSGEERPAAAEESATLINLNGSGAEIQGSRGRKREYNKHPRGRRLFCQR